MGVNGIYGLSGSGMDIESMVKVGMMAKQNEYDKMAQKYTKNEWKKSDFLDLSSQISTFNTSTLSQYKMSSSMNAKLVESTSSAVKATAGSAATLMSHTVEVKSLSANAYLIGTNKMTRHAITTDSSIDTSIKLADVLFSDVTKQVKNGETYLYGHVATSSADSTSYTFGKLNNQTYLEVLDSSESDFNSSSAFVQHYNTSTGQWETANAGDIPTDPGSWYGSSLTWNEWQAQNTAYQNYLNEINRGDGSNWRKVIEKPNLANVKLTDVAFSFMVTDGTQDISSMSSTEKAAHTISYTYGDLIDGGKTFTDLVNDINNKGGANIQATYDVDRDRFTIYNKQSGFKNSIQITIGADTGDSTKARAAITTRNFLDNLGLYQSINGTLTDQSGQAAAVNDGHSFKFALNGTITAKGEDNEVVIDGVTYNEASNKVTVNGVTYTAVEKGTATVSISQDTDAIIDKVKSFIADYNKLLGNLYAKYDEKPNSDYKPLSQTQKDQMKEEQIEKWEEKAKKGLLYHDQTIGKIIQEMRSAITDTVEGVDGQYNSVFSLGISTTGIKGQLVLDEDKLKKALAADPDAVYNVFAKLDSTDLDNKAKSGVAQRLGDVFVNATKNIKSRAGSSSDITEDSDLNNLLRNLQTRMSNFKKMMTTYENALYKKYDAMETMLTKLGTQLNFVMGSSS